MNKELLIQLMDGIGPSGYETPIRKIIEKEMKNYVDEVYTDKFGNLICHKKGKGEKAMLAAHMDEVALMVKKVEQNGFLRVSAVGGIEPIALVGQGVTILNERNQATCKGIITFPELHDATEVEELPKMDDLYIDTGIGKTELEKKGIGVGSYILPYHKTCTLGSEDIIMGKAMDDRVGCFILIEVAKKLKKAKSKQEAYYVFTVQEEIGMYGAKTAAWGIQPDWGVAVETTIANDSEIREGCQIGSGPYLTMKDSEMISNKCLDDWIRKIAKEKKIPLQLEVLEFGTTDATGIMLSRGGIPSTALSVPVRNIHSTVGVCNVKDIEYMIEILFLLFKSPPRVCEI